MLKTADGTPLFVTDWPNHKNQAGHGGIVLMHGLGEHSGRYVDIVRFLNDCGWSVRTYDHRGHGRSSGVRGDVPDDEAILRDAKMVVDDFAQYFAAPLLLFGHSMGGLFAARFATAALSPLRGLVLSSPALSIPRPMGQQLLLAALAAVAPGFGVPNGLKIRYLSHDVAVVDAYKKDQLVHPKISARLLRSMLAAVDFTQSHASALAIPALLVVAGDDRLVDASGSRAFFERLTPGIGTMHLYKDFYHEVFNEIDARRVFEDLRIWLAVRAEAV